MSPSSRRSSRSLRPIIPPSFRSISISKQSSPSLSLIVAEPEQGSPLASATAKLSSSPSGFRPSDSVSLHESMGQKRDRMDSVSTQRSVPNGGIEGGSTKRVKVESESPLTHASTDAPQSNDHSGATTEPIRQDSTAGTAVEGSNSMQFPTSEPTKSTTSTKSTSNANPSGSRGHSSWFGSLGRGRGREQMRQVREEQEQSSEGSQGGSTPKQLIATATPQGTPAATIVPTRTASPQSTATPPTAPDQQAPTESPPSEPRPIPSSKPQPKRSWFSSNPSSPPSRPPMSPPTPSFVSSVDEEVPELPPTPKTDHAPTTSPPLLESGDGAGGRVRLSSLNPSNSRFTLSIPLLGRPKIPLDQAVAVAKAGDTNKMGKHGDIPAATTEHVRQTTTITTETTSTTSQATEINNSSESSIATPDDKSTITPASSDSWWKYVGWGDAASSGNPSKLATSPSSEQSISDSPVVNIEPASPELKPRAASVHDLRSAAQEEGALEGVDKAAIHKPSSIRSAETANSYWYQPWAWYSNTTEGGLSSSGADAGEHGQTKTESEKVKEEALARDAETTAIPGPEPVPSSPGQLNPIESTISSNRSGWTTFFSSKSLVVKNIAAGENVERDENGAEVMNLDEDENAATMTDTSPSSAATTAKANTGKGKEGVVDKMPKKPTKASPPSSPKKLEPSSPNKKPPPDALVTPLTNSDSVKRDAAQAGKRTSSPSPSKKSGATTPITPRAPPPNLVLPTWSDTFQAPPRSLLPPQPTSTLKKTFTFVSDVLFAKDESIGKGKAKAREKQFGHFGKQLPRAWEVVGEKLIFDHDVLRGCRKVVVIGIHGWFPGAVVRTVLGEPTGTSSKFASMMVQALEEFQSRHDVKFEKITQMPLEGEGTIDKRLDKLYVSMIGNKEWMDDLSAADVIFVATHSQGSIVATHLLDRLIREGHIRTSRKPPTVDPMESVVAGGVSAVSASRPQRICCLAMCGIHLGPLRYLSSSSIVQPYIQYFESAAARELFQFQNTESQVSKAYANALQNVMDHGAKMVYIASLNDQVVPMYSGLFTAASHPLILRALYIDGDAYHSSDFLSNLLVLLLRVMNSGLSDSGLLAHLSEVTAGSVSGVGHSAVYEELAVFSLAVDYLFLTNDGLEEHPVLSVEPFNAASEQNDYEIPWALRDLIADERVVHFFSREVGKLRDEFREWHPKTSILRDIKRKLQPIQRLPASLAVSTGSGGSGSVSKL